MQKKKIVNQKKFYKIFYLLAYITLSIGSKNKLSSIYHLSLIIKDVQLIYESAININNNDLL